MRAEDNQFPRVLFTQETNSTQVSFTSASIMGVFAKTDGRVYQFNSAGESVLATGVGAGDGFNQAGFTNSTANSTMSLVWAGNSAGSGNVTMGLTGSTVTMSAPSGGGAAVTVSDSGLSGTIGRLYFDTRNNITLSLSTGAGGSHTIVGSINTSYRASTDAIGLNTAQTNVTWTVNSGGLSFNAGGYAGTTSGTTATTTAGTDLKVSMTHNTAGINLSFGQPAWLTTAMQSNAATISNINVSAGTTSNNLSAFTFSNGSGVSFGLNGSVITASVAAAGGAQTGISGLAGGGTTYTSGSVTFRDLNGISFLSTTGQQFQLTHELQYTSATSAITSNALHTSASRVINIVAATDNTGGGTASLSGNVSFSKANGMTFYTSVGGAVVASYTVPTQTAQTQSNVQGIWVSNTTFRTGDVSFSNANGITFTSNGANVISISHALAGTGTSITGNASITLDSAGLKFNGSGLAGTSTGFAGANISGSITHNSSGINLSLSVAAPGAAAENNWFNLLGANTAGNTTASGSTIGLSGINCTLSGTNNSVIVVSAANEMAISADGTAAAGSNSQSTGTVKFANSNNFTFGLSNNGTMTASHQQQLQSFYEPQMRGATASNTLASSPGGFYPQPFVIYQPLTIARLQLIGLMTTQSRTTMSVSYSFSSQTSSAGNASWGETYSAYLMSRVSTGTGDAARSRLVTFFSTTVSQSAAYSASVTWSNNISSATCSVTTSASFAGINGINAAGGVDYTTLTSSGSSSGSSTSTNQNSSSFSFPASFFSACMSSVRQLYIPFGTTLSPGEYWLALLSATSIGSTNYDFRSQLSCSKGLVIYTTNTVNFIRAGQTATQNSTQILPGWGVYAGAGSLTTTFAFSDLVGGQNSQTYFNFQGYSL